MRKLIWLLSALVILALFAYGGYILTFGHMEARIAWQTIQTGAAGHSEWQTDLGWRELSLFADQLNNHYSSIRHYAEWRWVMPNGRVVFGP